MRTGDLARRARESGLFFPPDPGAAEQSMLGGNPVTGKNGLHESPLDPRSVTRPTFAGLLSTMLIGGCA